MAKPDEEQFAYISRAPKPRQEQPQENYSYLKTPIFVDSFEERETLSDKLKRRAKHNPFVLGGKEFLKVNKTLKSRTRSTISISVLNRSKMRNRKTIWFAVVFILKRISVLKNLILELGNGVLYSHECINMYYITSSILKINII